MQIEGEHNVNPDYIQKIKQKNPNIKIVPRLYLDAGNEINFQLFDNRFRMDDAVAQIGALIKKYDKLFDGIVFDSPLNGYVGMVPFDLVYFLEALSNHLNEQDKFFMLSVLPLQMNAEREKRVKALEKLLKLSDKLLYCTYDYNSKIPGDMPISPIEWIQDELQIFFSESDLDSRFVKQKLMMGIPFYGNKYDATKKESMTAQSLLPLLESHSSQAKVEWQENHLECKIALTDRNMPTEIYYPCLKFIQERLNLFQEYEIGTFIWDAGQGFKYFYELF